TELIEGGKHVRLDEEGKGSKGEGELKDDGSTLEKAQTHISEREATQGGSGSPAGDATLGSRDQTTISKQATQVSLQAGRNRSLARKDGSTSFASHNSYNVYVESYYLMQSSQPWFGKDDPANQFNTPRILELDVNRMLIGQNNVSSIVPFPPSEDRLLNANKNMLRSYVTVNRPTAPLVSGERPSSRGSTKSTGRKARVSQIEKEIPEALPIPHPLPSISSIQGDEGYEEEEEEEEERKREIRAPSVAFSDEDDNEEEEEEDGENENTVYRFFYVTKDKKSSSTGQSLHIVPGSSLYHSVVTKNEDEEDDDDNDDKEDTTLTQD
ncbi:hypothetical protein RRG08_047630, partial [Elysia crispata]